MEKKRVLIVEDDADIADVLRAYLVRDGFEVDIAGDGLTGLTAYRRFKPDVVLLDMMLPMLSGADVLMQIRQDSTVPIIMVTAIGDESEKLGALRYGADDYVVKPYSPKEVVARVHAVLRRVSIYSHSDAHQDKLIHDRLWVDLAAKQAGVYCVLGADESTLLVLTPTEFNILSLLLQYPSRAYSRDELIERCLPESEALTRVVDVHVHNLRRKLEALGIVGVLVTVRAVGYRFR
ncbi:response regulator [Pseudomonas putida]|uniref:response regulator n=1 Tax=Pseudomonas putida TaxID=303 RepID=UPI00335D5EA3